MKKFVSIPRLLLLCLPFLVTHCATIPREHYSKQEIQFFSNKNEVNTSFSLDFNSYTMGLNLGGAWAFADNIFLNAGVTHYSKDYLPRTNVIEPGEINEGTTDFKGTRGRLGLGYFNNFGKEGTTYIEVQGEVGIASNTLEFVETQGPIGQTRWEYKPLDIGLGFAIGRNAPNIGVAFGLKAAQSFYGGEIPYSASEFFEPNRINRFVTDYFYVNPSFNLRAGGGPVKGQFSVGMLVNPFFEDLEEPTIKVSLGLNYVIGRKKVVKKKTDELKL